MRFQLVTSLLLSATMIAAPAVAQSQVSASKLSVVQGARAGSGLGRSSKLAGGSGTTIGLILAAGVVAIAVIAAAKNSNSTSP